MRSSTAAPYQYRVTPTMADNYDACPRSAALAPPFVSTPETERGQRLHQALYRSIALMQAHRPTSDEAVMSAAGIAVDSEEADEAQVMLTWVRGYLQEANLTVIGAEAPLETPPRPVLGAEGLRVQLVGRVDLVARAGRTLHLLDLKTGQRMLSDAQLAVRPSSAVYTLLARCTWPDTDRIMVTHLYSATRTVASTELTTPQIEAGRVTVRYVVGLFAERSAAQVTVPGEHCSWCPVRPDCPTWPTPVPGGANDTATF